MNRKLLALLMAAMTLPAAAAQYVKPGAVLTLHPGQNNAEFNINASTGDGSGVCNMEGTAQQITVGESQKRRWAWNDNTSQCVAVISELKNGNVDSICQCNTPFNYLFRCFELQCLSRSVV